MSVKRGKSMVDLPRHSLLNAVMAGEQSLPTSPETVIEALSVFVTSERLQRIDAVVRQRSAAVVAVFERPGDPHNVAAALRSADAFGMAQVHLIGEASAYFSSPAVCRGADQWLEIVQHTRPIDCIAALHSEGYQVWAATLQGEKTPANLADGRVAIVFGHERHGVSEEVLALVDARYCIPMLGFVESLNLSVAAAITMHAARLLGPKEPENRDRRLHWKALMLMRCVANAEQIVRKHLASTGDRD